MSLRHVKALSLVVSFLVTLMIARAAAAEGDLRLVEAARNRNVQQIRALLGQRVDVNVRSHDGATALLWAAHWNDVEAADLLVRAGADANIANDFLVTPLSLACTSRNAAAPCQPRPTAWVKRSRQTTRRPNGAALTTTP